jgi:hypothetical protein
VLNLKVSVRCGLSAASAQIRWTVVLLIRIRSAIRRALQWVVPSGGGRNVRAMIRSRTSRP